MSLTQLPQAPQTPRPTSEPQTAGLIREMSEQGGVLYKMIMDAMQDSPRTEHLAVSPLNKVYTQGNPDEVAPINPDGSYDQEFFDILNDPKRAIASGHNHPSKMSISPEDLSAWTTYSTIPDDPATQWIFKPDNYREDPLGYILDDYEGVRMIDEDLKWTPEEIAKINTHTRNPVSDHRNYPSPMEDLLRKMGDPQAEMETDHLDLLDDFAPGGDFQRLPLMYLGQKDVIDYYTPPSEGMDELLKIYTNLLENQ